MKRILRPVGPALLILLSGVAGSQNAPTTRDLTVRVLKDDWGDASLADIRAVLNSSGAELMNHVPDRRLAPILISRSRDNPIVLYDRGPKREYQVKLNVTGTHWAQFAFQFAHELCHILSQYDREDDPNEWFEETLCETASLFALRRMAVTWKTAPPYPNWKSYAVHLRRYADDRMKKHPLPDGTTVAAFYLDNRKELRKNKANRKLNTIIAIRLLPLFEASPEHWEAVGWLNQGNGKNRSFADYLRDWHAAVPRKHRDFVARIGKLFDVTME